MIKYSIIVPHKNCPNLLERCIDSIPARDDIQIIVVDDNSDEDKRPSTKLDGVEIVLLDPEQAKGAGRARNEGLKRAKGKWLLFSDADDFFDTENLNNAFDTYKDSDVDIIFFNANRVEESTGELLSQHMSKKKYEKNHDKFLNIMRYWSNVPWAKFIKRDIITKYDIRFSEVPSANDLYFSAVSGFYAKKITVDFSPIYNYRVRTSGNITSVISKQSIISRLSEASKRNEFLWKKGEKTWCTNLYKFFYDKLLDVGCSRKEASDLISDYITVGPQNRWLVSYMLQEPFVYLRKSVRSFLK